MKKLSFLILTITFLSIYCDAQDFPYDKYLTRTLAELVDDNSPKPNRPVEKIDLLISAKPFYSAVRVKYVGGSRPISDTKKMLIKTWQESLGYDANVIKLFENEYLFKECEKEYWLPVQKPVASYFPKELAENDNITLYLMVVGGLKVSEKWEPVFLVNEFNKY